MIQESLTKTVNAKFYEYRKFYQELVKSFEKGKV